MVGCCKHSNETLGSIKVGNFSPCLMECVPSNMGCTGKDLEMKEQFVLEPSLLMCLMQGC